MASHGRALSRWIKPHSAQGIRPDKYDGHGDGSILDDFEALQECGFIEDEHPDCVLQEVAEDFLGFIAPMLQDSTRRSQLAAKLGNTEWKPYRMFREKIAPELLELLAHEGLARATGEYEVEFEGSVGALYMLFLARRMAQARAIISDDPTYQALTFGPPSAATHSGDAGFLLATAIFRTSVPLDIGTVDIKQLISLRRDLAGERIAFYDGLARLGSDMSKIENEKQLNQAIDHHESAIHNNIEALEKKLRLLKLTCGKGVFSFSMPAAATGAAWGLGLTNPAALFGVGSLVIAGLIVGSRFENRIAKADSTVAYIHSLRTALAPHEYGKKFIQLNLGGRGG